MSCRHDLAVGTCKTCYPDTGTIDPGFDEPNGLDGPGAIQFGGTEPNPIPSILVQENRPVSIPIIDQKVVIVDDLATSPFQHEFLEAVEGKEKVAIDLAPKRHQHGELADVVEIPIPREIHILGEPMRVIGVDVASGEDQTAVSSLDFQGRQITWQAAVNLARRGYRDFFLRDIQLLNDVLGRTLTDPLRNSAKAAITRLYGAFDEVLNRREDYRRQRDEARSQAKDAALDRIKAILRQKFPELSMHSRPWTVASYVQMLSDQLDDAKRALDRIRAMELERARKLGVESAAFLNSNVNPTLDVAPETLRAEQSPITHGAPSRSSFVILDDIIQPTKPVPDDYTGPLPNKT